MNFCFKKAILYSSLFFCLGCANQRVILNSQPTSIEPLPIKFGGFKDSGIEIAIPIKTEKKKTGGFRSPVEIRLKALLTNWDVINVPIEPTGAVCGVRVRW